MKRVSMCVMMMAAACACSALGASYTVSRVISVNKCGGSASDKASDSAGIIAVSEAAWNNYSDVNTDHSDGVIWDGVTSATLSPNWSVNLSGTGGYYWVPTGIESILRCYIDDNASNHAKMIFTDIPFKKYDVYVYMAADGSAKFSPVSTIIGGVTTSYTCGEDGIAVEGTSAWGQSQTLTSKLGTNVICIKDLMASDLTIDGGTRGTTRGAIAAVQIVEPMPATTWTGAAHDNDPTNDANWEDGDNPYAKSSKKFTKSFQLAADADWSSTAIASLGGYIAYLQGHSLKVSAFTSAGTAGTVTDTTTDTAKPGTFIANVASGKTWNNSGVLLSGNLRFVKEGAGTFTGRKTGQSYTGGTVVNAGTLKSYNAESSHYYGADGTPVTVNEGGTLDTAGKSGWHVHDVILNGGTLANTGANQTSYTVEGIGNITLTADSKVSLKYHILVYKKAGANIDLGGHTLTVERTSSTSTVQFTLKTAAVSNGTLAFGPGIRFYTYDDNVTLGDDVKVELNGCVDWWKKYPISVGELVANSTAAKDANLITVTKKFSTEGSFDNVELADGAVLDLNGNEGVFSTASGFDGCTLTFASGAKITVDIGKRTFAEGDKVISWSAKPGATFKWDSQTAKKGYPAVAREDGLYFGGGSDVIAIAHWTNASGDGDIANADNWACTNAASAKVVGALPTSDTTVYLHGDKPIAVATSVTWGGICLTGVLTADFDLSGVTSVKFSSGASFDLNGRVVKTGPISAESSAVTISDSQLATTSPGALALTNGVSQLFAGLETEPGVRIRVLGGATLDLNGINGKVFRAVLEDGSTLANTGDEIGSKTGDTVVGGGLELAAGATATADMSSIVHFRATDDASYPIALNGGTLVKTGARVEIVNGDITGPGTIRVAASELYIGKAGVRIADDVVIYVEQGGPYLWAMADVSVPNVAGDGTIKGNYYYTVTKRLSGLLTVDGKGTQFASGMTLDLTGNAGAYAVPAKVTMLENATITLDLAGRTDVAAGTKVVSWTTATAPSETVRFIVDGAPYIVIRKSDGLYLLSSEGLILGVR